MVQPNAAQWRAIFDRVDSLLTLSPDARHSAIEAMTGADQPNDIVGKVVRDWHQRTSVETALHNSSAEQVAKSLLAMNGLREGQRFGNYRLLEPIGQGGMGSVWRAERSDGLYQSQVAVKLLGSLALSAHARARFAHEGELLARLTHPNIARLLDAGLTEDSQRFLVLELVQGQNVVSYVRSTLKTTPQIVALFRQVLSAVAFAHTQLVVHRDIKPGNVMVNGAGQVKLLDFGVGKLLDDGDAGNDLTQMVGAAFTEAYAAPEQLRGDPVSTSVDVFALGTLLCELLTGARPKWPGDKRTLKAGLQALGLESIVDPDLRAIVGKAIAIDVAERYPSVAAFDEDVVRYQANEPVRAQPATRMYQLRKFLLRNRLPVFAAGAASLAIVGSLGVAVWQLQEARLQRSQALQEASRANQVTAFVTGLFRASDMRMPSTQDKRSLTALQVLDAGRERLKSELDDQPETKVALLGVLAEVYGIMGDGERFEALNNERIRLATEWLGPLHPAALNGRMTDAEADLYSVNYDAARITMTALQPLFQKVFGETSERYAHVLATRADLERRAVVEPNSRILARFVEALAIFSAMKSDSEAHAISMQNYSTALARDGQLRESLAVGEQAIRRMERLQEFDHGGLAIAYDRRADTLQKLDRHELVEPALDRALALMRQSYGSSGTLYLNTLLAKARWLHGRGRRSEAWALVDQVFATVRQPSTDTFGVPEQHYVRGLLLLNENRATEAAAELTLAAKGWRDANNNPARLKQAEVSLGLAKKLASQSSSKS